MKTVFREMMEQSSVVQGGDGSRYAAVALMVASMEQTPQGTLPSDDDEIAGLIGLRSDKWLVIKPKVFACGWVIQDGRWVNKSLRKWATEPKQPKRRATAEKHDACGLISFNSALACFDGLDEKRKKAWQRLHPTADLDILLAECANHLLDNPDAAAKIRNFSRFITNWIKKARIINPIAMLKDPIKESGPHFMAFWGAYHPSRRINFTRAASAWKAQNLDGEAGAVMEGLARWLESKDWNENNGEFVPSPDKWLLAKRWLDEPAVYKQTAIIKDSRGRVVGHDRSMTGRDYGSIGSFSSR